MKKIGVLLLSIVLILGIFYGCEGKPKEPEDVTAVDYEAIKKQELGSMMPELIYARDGQVAFWGEFGLFIINGEDGSIHRGKNLEKIGYNHMGGELTTVFTVSSGYETIYFFNVDESDNNIEKYYYRFDIEEDTIKRAPITDEVEVVDERPIFTIQDMGGPIPEEGYTTNPMFYADEEVVYLHSKEWKVNDLELVRYSHKTGEYTRITIFE